MKSPADPKPSLPERINRWFALHMAWCWGRYWGARLMATTHYSQMLSHQQPEISGWLNVKRHGLSVLLFILPIRHPVRPQFSKGPVAETDQGAQ